MKKSPDPSEVVLWRYSSLLKRALKVDWLEGERGRVLRVTDDAVVTPVPGVPSLCACKTETPGVLTLLIRGSARLTERWQSVGNNVL